MIDWHSKLTDLFSRVLRIRSFKIEHRGAAAVNAR